jgi:hypothetical protein
MADATDLKSVGLKRPVPVRVRPSAFFSKVKPGLRLPEAFTMLISVLVKKGLFFGILLVISDSIVHAGSYQRTREGNILVWNDDPKPGVAVNWSGRRDREGYATGNGTLTFLAPTKTMETGTFIPSTRRYAIVAAYSGKMAHGKFVGSPKGSKSAPTPMPQARNRKSSKANNANAVPKTPAPAKAKATPAIASPTPSPTATPTPAESAPAATPSTTPSDESLNSLTRPPSSLGLPSPAETQSPGPAPSSSPSPPRP